MSGERERSDEIRIALLEREAEVINVNLNSLREEVKELSSINRIQQRTVERMDRDVERTKEDVKVVTNQVTELNTLPLEELKTLPKKVASTAIVTDVAKWFLIVVIVGIVNVVVKDIPFF